MLILGYSVIIMGSMAFFFMLALQVHQQGTFWFDTPVLTFLAEHRTVALDYFFLFITWAGSNFLLIPISIIIVTILLRHHHYSEALLLGIGLSGVSLINPGLKALFLRERPTLFPLLQDYGGFAFPSGHTAQIVAFTLAVFLIIHRIQPRWQRLAAILLSILALSVATSRLYLQVHYPSDVLGGCLVAFIWVFSIDALIQITIKNRQKNRRIIMDSLQKLAKLGQSYWIDDLTRHMIISGELQRRIEEQDLRGITSNPHIFNEAIAKSDDYDAQIQALRADNRSPAEIYEVLVTADVQNACNILRPVYDKLAGQDGFVSLEVSPYLAHDTAGSIKEAQRLWEKVNRPNLFIKIPGTEAGIPAIEELLFEGININITLLFSIERYEAVAYAYLNALERRLKAGRSVDKIASVASFFLSRIDVLVDQLLSHRIPPEGKSAMAPHPEDLLGKVAIANAKLAYQSFKQIIHSERWKALQAKGACVQRMLWASTSTKNPAYRDVMYVEPLIGPHTINTMPEKTIAAFADHGVAAETVEENVGEARKTLLDLQRLGIDFKAVTAQLENEGIQKFIDPYDALLKRIGA